MKAFFVQLCQDANEWCQGRMWFLRAFVTLYFAWALLNHLSDSRYQSLFGLLNLGIHELGHVVFMPLAQFMTAAGGTLLQCLVPCIGIVMFLGQRDYFAISFGFGWLSTNLFGVATYMADARAMALPLVSPFTKHPKHDWNGMLGQMGMLSWDQHFAFFTRAAAVISMLICLVAGTWMLWRMLRSTLAPKMGRPH